MMQGVVDDINQLIILGDNPPKCIYFSIITIHADDINVNKYEKLHAADTQFTKTFPDAIIKMDILSREFAAKAEAAGHPLEIVDASDSVQGATRDFDDGVMFGLNILKDSTDSAVVMIGVLMHNSENRILQ